MEITGLEADWLLYALDKYCGTDSRGKIPLSHRFPEHGFDVQDLRDRLMAIHEHPKWQTGEEE